MTGKCATLIDLLERRAAAGDAVLYTYLDKSLCPQHTLTFAGVYHRARRIAGYLQQAGLQHRPVLLLYPHNADFLTAFWGCILAAAIPMPLSPPRGRNWQQIDTVARAFGVDAMLTTSGLRRGHRLRGPGPGLRRLSTEQIDIDPACAPGWVRPEIDSRDIAFVQFSSGSTARPKAISVSHGNVLHNSRAIKEAMAINRNDITVSWLPFYHDMGLIGHVVQPLYSGIANYFLSPIAFAARPKAWLEAISRYGGTISGAPNFAYRLCVDKLSGEDPAALDLASWRVAYCGSERIDVKTLQGFARQFAGSGFNRASLFPCYGLAETTLYVSGYHGLDEAGDGQSGASYACVGRVTPHSRVRILHPRTRKDCRDGETGEICVRSQSVAAVLDPAATPRGDGGKWPAIRGKNRFLRTGDLGFRREDRLYYVGRIKDRVKIRGRNYAAEDIERVSLHAAGTAGFSRGVALNAEQDDDRLVILLEHNGRHPESALGPVTTRVRHDLCKAFSIVPGEVLFLKKHSIPLTTSGKVQRHRCRQQYLKDRYLSRRLPDPGARNPEAIANP